MVTVLLFHLIGWAQKIYQNGKIVDLKIYDNQYHLKEVPAGKHLINIKLYI